MFRQEEICFGGWKDKTIEHMQRRRFEQRVMQLQPLGAGRIENLSSAAFSRLLEHCWQDIEKKPMRAQQEAQVQSVLLAGLQMQADCLSTGEHELVEKALVLGGSAPIDDTLELDAAQALALRLWANIGLVSGKPYIEINEPLLGPVAKAFASQEHELVRRRFDQFYAGMHAALYRLGAMDDRQPQMQIIRQVFRAECVPEHVLQLARRYLWASFDCVDYSEGVLLLHSAIADPQHMLTDIRRRSGLIVPEGIGWTAETDILPEEIPLQRALEHAIEGAVRSGMRAQEVARSIRFLCKQGAPLLAMQDVLQSALIVYLNPVMHAALADMFYGMPKWVECGECNLLQ